MTDNRTVRINYAATKIGILALEAQRRIQVEQEGNPLKSNWVRLSKKDFYGKFDVTSMRADRDDLSAVYEACVKHRCNAFCVADGKAYLKRIEHNGETLVPNDSRHELHVTRDILPAIMIPGGKLALLSPVTSAWSWAKLHKKDLGGRFDVTHMRADNMKQVLEACNKHNCNAFCYGELNGVRYAWLKRVRRGNVSTVPNDSRHALYLRKDLRGFVVDRKHFPSKAPEGVKTTTIEMAEHSEHDIHNISQIIAAWYGPKGCYRNDFLAKDVLDVVKQMMTNGMIPLAGQKLNNVFGDPAVGKHKCLCVEIVKKDAVMKKDLEPGKTVLRLGNWSDTRSTGKWLVHDGSRITVASSLSKYVVKCSDWKDQGWGGRKGAVQVVLVRDSKDIASMDCWGIAKHSAESASRTFSSSDDVLSKSQPGDKLELRMRVGGGGGHKLYINDLVVEAYEEEVKPTTTTFEMAEGSERDITVYSEPIAAWYGPKGCSKDDILAKDVLDVVMRKMMYGQIPLSGQRLNNVFGDPAPGKHKCLYVEVRKGDLAGDRAKADVQIKADVQKTICDDYVMADVQAKADVQVDVDLDAQTLKKLEETGDAEGCYVAGGHPARAAKNLRMGGRGGRVYYYFDGCKGWAEYDLPKSRDADSMFVFVKLTTDKPRPVNISVDGVGAGTFFKEADTGSFSYDGLKWFSAGMLQCPGGRDSIKLRLDPASFAPHIAAVAVLPVETTRQYSNCPPVADFMEPEEAKKVAEAHRETMRLRKEYAKEIAKQGVSPGTVKLTPGTVVRLKCHHTGKNLALNEDGSQDPTGIRSNGGNGDYAKWIVHGTNAKAIRLQNFKNKSRWLRIMDDGTSNANGTGYFDSEGIFVGTGGGWTHFIPQYRGNGKVSLACARKPKWHVGFKKNGDLKEASETGAGKCGWFYISAV